MHGCRVAAEPVQEWVRACTATMGGELDDRNPVYAEIAVVGSV